MNFTPALFKTIEDSDDSLSSNAWSNSRAIFEEESSIEMPLRCL